MLHLNEERVAAGNLTSVGSHFDLVAVKKKKEKKKDWVIF